MDIYYGICAGVFTSAVVIAVVYLVRTLEQVRKTAEQAQKTAHQIELLARHADETATAVGNVATSVASISDGLKSGWLRAAQAAVSFLSGLRQKMAESNGEGAESEEEIEHEASEEP
jgi:uncharacterized protein YoxC